MAFTLYQKNKKTGVVYAFHAESYRDPVTKKPKNRRTYLGRVDPETGKIIPKKENGKRNRSPLGEAQESNDVLPVGVADLLAKQREEIQYLKEENSKLKQELEKHKQNSEEQKSHIKDICIQLGKLYT